MTLRAPKTWWIGLLALTAACNGGQSDSSSAEAGSGSDDSTGSVGSVGTVNPTQTETETETQTQGPSTTASTTNPDVTSEPTGPDDTSSNPESSTGDPVDPPTEIETVYELPAGAFFENLAVTADGTILIADHAQKQIFSLTPQGEADVFADLDGWPLGIAVDSDGTVIIAAHHSLMFDNAQTFVTSNVMYVADGNGGADVLTEMPEAGFVNGITMLAPGVVLAADSSAGTIWRIDAASGDVETWLAHPLLTQENPNLPAANGIKLHEGTIFVSNSDRGTLLQIPVADDGSAGVPTTYFTGPLIDDFTIAASGAIYATTHGNDVFRINPDLSMETIASVAQGVVGNTAVAFGRTAFDDETVYVTTDGGLFVAGGNAGQSGPGRVVRIPVGELQ